MDTMKRVFEVLQLFQGTPGYTTICLAGVYDTAPGRERHKTCRIHAATRFWWHNSKLFDDQVTSDEELKEILSADEYPLGTPVGDHDFILGNYKVIPRSNTASEGNSSLWNITNNHATFDTGNENGTLLISAQSYIIRIELPVIDIETSAFEDLVTKELLSLRQEWENDPDNPVRLELFTFRSIPNEFLRAIFLDLPLYPAVFFIMVGFSSLVFYRRDPVQSRCLLGFGSVCTIGLSLLTGELVISSRRVSPSCSDRKKADIFLFALGAGMMSIVGTYNIFFSVHPLLPYRPPHSRITKISFYRGSLDQSDWEPCFCCIWSWP